MKSSKYTILIVTGLFFSCGNNEKKMNEQQEKDLFDKVIGIHDEVMPKMSTILFLESQISKRILELDSSNEKTPEEIKIYKDQIARLQIADEAMMQWMRNFEINQEGWSHDSIMSYLEVEKKSISLVRDQMLEAIESAEELLGN